MVYNVTQIAERLRPLAPNQTEQDLRRAVAAFSDGEPHALITRCTLPYVRILACSAADLGVERMAALWQLLDDMGVPDATQTWL